MARTKNPAEFDIVVDAEPYVWWLQRKPRWSSDPKERHGMALGARHKEGQREAVMEFPFGPQPRLGAPQLQPAQIDTKLVARAISAAVAAGWEPLSRGKTVTIIVDATGA
jgi:hypothetical protein